MLMVLPLRIWKKWHHFPKLSEHLKYRRGHPGPVYRQRGPHGVVGVRTRAAILEERTGMPGGREV